VCLKVQLLIFLLLTDNNKIAIENLKRIIKYKIRFKRSKI